MTSTVIAVARLRHRLTLEVPQPTQDGAGGRSKAFSALGSLWAEIIPLTGREREWGGREGSIITHKIRMRYRANITTAMRLRHNDKVFNIHSFYDPLGDTRWLIVLAQEII